MKTKPALLQSLVRLAVLLMMPAVLQAQFGFTINPTLNTIYTGGIPYSFYTYTLTFQAYNYPDSAVIIPSSIHGIPVTRIANGATTSLGTRITIPDSVTSIGEYAFTRALTNVVIGSGVTNIGSYAFSEPV